MSLILTAPLTRRLKLIDASLMLSSCALSNVFFTKTNQTDIVRVIGHSHSSLHNNGHVFDLKGEQVAP